MGRRSIFDEGQPENTPEDAPPAYRRTVMLMGAVALLLVAFVGTAIVYYFHVIQPFDVMAPAKAVTHEVVGAPKP